VIFNKSDLKVPAFDEFLKLESAHFKILYCTGKIEFIDNSNYLLKFSSSDI
jgi:hypothetical protein